MKSIEIKKKDVTYWREAGCWAFKVFKDGNKFENNLLYTVKPTLREIEIAIITEHRNLVENIEMKKDELVEAKYKEAEFKKEWLNNA